MENQEAASNQKTVYQYLDLQTVQQRKEFVKALKQEKISTQQFSNWLRKVNSIPEKYHALICELAGEQLTFPKVKVITTVEEPVA